MSDKMKDYVTGNDTYKRPKNALDPDAMRAAYLAERGLQPPSEGKDFLTGNEYYKTSKKARLDTEAIKLQNPEAVARALRKLFDE